MSTADVVPVPPFPLHPRRPGEPEPDLTGFVLIHRALRSGARTVADACTAIADGAPCPSERRDALAWFAEHVLFETHAHHRKEDEVLWPVIALSAGNRIDLDPLTDDHRALEQLLRRADDLLARFRTDTATAGELGVVMGGIADELDEHIADEEATVFPVMREFVSARDFARCEKLFQRGSSVGQLTFVLPWIIEQCSPAERAELMPKAPLPLRVLLRVVEGRWQRRAVIVRG